MSDSEEEVGSQQEKILKIVVVGDGSSGKTSICKRFAQDEFARNYHQTLGLDFYSKRLILPGEIHVLLQVWDIGGQSISGPMIDKYVFGCHAVILVYDVTNSVSFENLADWISVVKRITKQQEKPPLMCLVGNKTDMEHRRNVRIEKHTKFLEQNQMSGHYVSAKTGDSVLLMFRQTAAEVLGIQLSKADMESDIIVVNAPITVNKPTLADKSAKKLPIDHTKNSAVCAIQ
ncbi:hypothetical protein L596_005477 [Steinernema carpocapsae]|uniref:Ras-related protein Rab-28 n=1 Tax=Steinernema carpocapsae TaxID=34508 RepID=A0A4U8UZ84_STECR|nr:hypothetical protein L596_005477 [Steinernema carpocapsae]